MKELVVEKENELKRLDVFLVSNLNESRNFILKNIKNGNMKKWVRKMNSNKTKAIDDLENMI